MEVPLTKAKLLYPFKNGNFCANLTGLGTHDIKKQTNTKHKCNVFKNQIQVIILPLKKSVQVFGQNKVGSHSTFNYNVARDHIQVEDTS